MIVNEWNRLTVFAALGGPVGQQVIELIDAMANLDDGRRVVVFQVLGDHFCRRCGRDQSAGGDCACTG